MKLNPIRLFTATQLHWFEAGQDDSLYLERWRDAAPNYTSGQGGGAGWHSDHYMEIVRQRATEADFRRAAAALLRYEFYPPSVMHHVSTFGREQRPMRVGDRIVQRIHVFRPFGLPVIDVVTMNLVTDVIDTARSAGFTYITTGAHSEEGEWSARVDWQDDDALALTVRATSRPSPREPRLIHPLMRRLQQRAHHLGIDAFRAAVEAAATPEGNK